MRKLTAYNFITLNGYYKGPGGDISWHQHGGEEEQFSVNSLEAHNVLVFGRVTYEMMASFWPTEDAMNMMPEVAKGMNDAEKIVFSNTLQKADWQNTRVIGGDIVAAMKKLKAEPGNDMTILGSGSIISQLADAGLIDGYQFMIDPIAIAGGTPIFSGIQHSLQLELINTRSFKSGVVLLEYQPR